MGSVDINGARYPRIWSLAIFRKSNNTGHRAFPQHIGVEFWCRIQTSLTTSPGFKQAGVESIVRVVQLGTPRHKEEGLRLGTVRRPPRGVRRKDYGHRNYYDLWLPELAPSAPLVSWALSQPFDSKRWATYARKYLAEMRKPSPQRLIALLAALSQHSDFSIGCYCGNESRCHRSLLRKLLREHGARMA